MKENIVSTNSNYTSFVLFQNINTLLTTYPFLHVQIIGFSVLGKPIPVLRFGTGRKEVFYNASIHANEWITSPLLMKFTEDLCEAYEQDTMILGHSARDLYENTSIYLAPMLNPDGVNLVTGAIKEEETPYLQAKEISQNYPALPFPSGWKANIEGIDLNLQFPAGWENAQEIKHSQGFVSPAPRDYVGPAPLVAKEAIAVYQFTLQHNFRLILTYHTQGKEIYWQFQDYAPEEAYLIGQEFAHVSDYLLAEVPYVSSFAGYKDWFLQTFRRPGYTIEAGLGQNPLPISQFDEIYHDNIGILMLGAVL